MLKAQSIRVKILHTDNYHRIYPLDRREHRISNNYELVGVEEYDWDLLHRNIDDFRQNRKGSVPCINIITEEVDELVTDFNNIRVLVIDGLYAIRTERVDLRVFIDLTYHETKLSQLLRGKEPADGYRWSAPEREHCHVRSLMRLADLHANRNYQVLDPASRQSIHVKRSP
ncbi:uridine kinase [Chlorobaculum sp. MV4-Y]|uniref:uridine kinase n=1 Tax=Chlorobaculum sp. MV4-Y TaxID=2976335 RepID=UPI0021AE7E6A|nr:uridine kinase [Chlorobaculum sp. MV4-Y]UWX56793.1 uridine kinase [Chlorobaculum sp. MV4-Y]